MNLCIIPARGDSKRIPRKNIKTFCGKPIIAWSIETALKSKCFERVVVSTDSQEIAEIAHHYGATVPFMRPKELSDDYTGTIPVIRHAIEWFQDREIAFEHVCCLYATAPFVRIEDLRNGMEQLVTSAAEYTFSVTGFDFPIQRAIRITEKGRVEMFYPEYFNTRSQDLEKAYHDAGQFYWGRTAAWLSEKIIFGPDSIPIVLPRFRVQDIDTFEDWNRAEMLFKVLQCPQ